MALVGIKGTGWVGFHLSSRILKYRSKINERSNGDVRCGNESRGIARARARVIKKERDIIAEQYRLMSADPARGPASVHTRTMIVYRKLITNADRWYFQKSREPI